MNKQNRILFIDYLRGLAVIVMIEVHVVNAFLKPEIRNNWWFEIINYINGLVAPTFLFITGFAFIIALEKKWNDYLQYNDILFKQIKKIFQILIIGYALHLPYFSFHRFFFEMNESAYLNFLKVDVLHCIAFSLMFLLFLVLVLKNKNYLFYASLFFLLLIIFLTPIIWNISFKNFSTPIAMYFNSQQGSMFPIFPWASFIFSGVVVAFLYLHFQSDKKIFNKMILYSLIVIAITIIVKFIPFSFYTNLNYYRTSPNFFFQRIAIVIFLLGFLGTLETKNKLKNSFVNLVGSESLLVYSIHLLIIYGMFFDKKSISFIFGKTQNFLTTILLSISLIFFMTIVTYFWNFIKKKKLIYRRIIQYSTLTIGLLFFFTH